MGGKFVLLESDGYVRHLKHSPNVRFLICSTVATVDGSVDVIKAVQGNNSAEKSSLLGEAPLKLHFSRDVPLHLPPREEWRVLVSPAVILWRKLSFRIRQSALAVGHPIAIMAGVLENHLGSFSVRLLSSPSRDSSMDMDRAQRHQFSDPYSRTGSTHVSIRERHEMGERSPWKDPRLL